MARQELDEFRKKTDVKTEKINDTREEKLRSLNEEEWSKWITSYLGVLITTAEYEGMEFDKEEYDLARWASMRNRVNPKFVLRSYMVEEAADAAEKSGDFSKVNELLI